MKLKSIVIIILLFLFQITSESYAIEISEEVDIDGFLNSAKEYAGEVFPELENENIELREQALEMQARLDEMQKEYDDLETQLITLAKKYRELTEHWSYKVFGKKK